MNLQHTRKFKVTLLVTLALLSLLVVNVISASEDNQIQIKTDLVPPTIGGYQVQPGGVLEGLPEDIAQAPQACDGAAGSYVSPGDDAIRTTMIQFDNIVHDNKDPELVLYALYALEANVFLHLDAFFNSPQEMDKVGDFTDGMVRTIGNNSVCLTEGMMTARLWELNDGTWVIDSIKFNEAYDISDAWNTNPSPNLNAKQFDLPVLVEGVVIRYLMPYIEPPITTLPGGNTDQILSGAPIHCDGTAPSYLSVGMDVAFFGYGYAEFPTNIGADYTNWQFDGTQVALGDYGSTVYEQIRNETPMTDIVGNFESVTMSAEELYDGIKFGTVLDGPYCTASDVSEPFYGNGNYPDESTIGDDRFYTWWKININGTIGWYPEIVGQYSFWLWDNHGMFNRKLNMYFMVPFGESQTSSANTCPPSTMYAGLEVQPAVGTMNLRADSNQRGDVLARLEMSETIILSSGPICEEGSNWWWTDRGFLAENDPQTRVGLLLPAVQQVREAATRGDDTTEETVVTPEPSQPEPQETPEPEDDDDDKKDKKKKDKDRDDDDSSTNITTATFSGSSSSSCDPATGRGC